MLPLGAHGFGGYHVFTCALPFLIYPYFVGDYSATCSDDSAATFTGECGLLYPAFDPGGYTCFCGPLCTALDNCGSDTTSYSGRCEYFWCLSSLVSCYITTCFGGSPTICTGVCKPYPAFNYREFDTITYRDYGVYLWCVSLLVSSYTAMCFGVSAITCTGVCGLYPALDYREFDTFTYCGVYLWCVSLLVCGYHCRYAAVHAAMVRG